jgi:hypothetical protein
MRQLVVFRIPFVDQFLLRGTLFWTATLSVAVAFLSGLRLRNLLRLCYKIPQLVIYCQLKMPGLLF